MSKRNWKSTALSVPVVLVAAGAYAQAPQATDVTKNLRSRLGIRLSMSRIACSMGMPRFCD